MNHDRLGLMAITPLFKRLIYIAIAVGIYYYINSHYYYQRHIEGIYIALKVFIALQILAGATRTLLMPILGIAAFIFFLYLSDFTGQAIISSMDNFQLLGVSIFGILVTFMFKIK